MDEVPASLVVGTEPGGVSSRAVRETQKVSVCAYGMTLGGRSGVYELLLLGRRAAAEADSLLVNAGDGKGTSEVNLGSILTDGIDVLEGPISIDVGEQVRWLDGVLSRTRQSEIVRSGNWW